MNYCLTNEIPEQITHIEIVTSLTDLYNLHTPNKFRINNEIITLHSSVKVANKAYQEFVSNIMKLQNENLLDQNFNQFSLLKVDIFGFFEPIVHCAELLDREMVKQFKIIWFEDPVPFKIWEYKDKDKQWNCVTINSKVNNYHKLSQIKERYETVNILSKWLMKTNPSVIIKVKFLIANGLRYSVNTDKQGTINIISKNNLQFRVEEVNMDDHGETSGNSSNKNDSPENNDNNLENKELQYEKHNPVIYNTILSNVKLESLCNSKDIRIIKHKLGGCKGLEIINPEV